MIPTGAEPDGTAPGAGAIVYFAGSDWDSVAGTDRRLVTALGRRRPVLWVEPPVSVVAALHGNGRLGDRMGLSEVAPGVTRLKVSAPPMSSRTGMRELTAAIRSRAVASAVRALGLDVAATVVASPRERFPRPTPGVPVLYVTDDWIEGAGMMGLDPDRIRRDLDRNTRVAASVLAVSPIIAARHRDSNGREAEVLANGCELPPSDPPRDRRRRAVIVGQLNERLDVSLLEAVVAAGVDLQVIGPRTERDPATTAALDLLFATSGVEYLGVLPAGDLAPHLAEAAVGLTPYADNAFNRSSFPLKTLEYLAHGLPVVSTPLPAVDWLATDHIAVGRDSAEFVGRVLDAVDADAGPGVEQERRAFAARHSWDARAEQLLALVDGFRAGAASVS